MNLIYTMQLLVHVQSGDVRKQQRVGKEIDKPEYLIDEYKMEKWYNLFYRNDKDKEKMSPCSER